MFKTMVALEEKPHFLTCLRRLKVSFATIFDHGKSIEYKGKISLKIHLNQN
jgi:hypothetical protein